MVAETAQVGTDAGRKFKEDAVELRDVRTLSPEAQEELRIRAVHAVVELKMTQTEVARIFGVARPVLNGWVSDYRTGGSDALLSKRRGRKPKPALPEEEQKRLLKLMRDHRPDELGYSGALWTRQTSGELLADHFDLARSRWTVGRILRAFGLSPQKPVHAAYEQNKEAVEKWTREEFPAIRERAEAEGVDIHWLDEAGVGSRTRRGTNWAPVGEPAVVRSTGKRFGCSFVATVTDDGQIRFMVYEGSFDANRMMTFLRRLIRDAPRKVFVIMDRLRVHTGKAVGSWLAEHQDEIEVFFLPSYSPDLNPAEVLNSDVKGQIGRRRKARNKGELLREVRSILYSIKRDAGRVVNYFLHRQLDYARPIEFC